MRPVALFRFLVVASVVPAVIAIVIKITGAGVPGDLLQYKDSHAHAFVDSAGFIVYLLSLATAMGFVCAFVALLFFRMWARELAVLSLLLSWLLAIVRGPSIEAGWTISLQEIACVLWVAAISMAYSPPIRQLFPHERGTGIVPPGTPLLRSWSQADSSLRFDDFTVLFEGIPLDDPDLILSESLREVERNSSSYYHLLRLANAYWRLHDWPKCVEFAQRVLQVEPDSFYARKILVKGHAELDQHEACYEQAKKLLTASPTNWERAKRFPWFLRPLAIFPKPRARLHWWQQQCDLEARNDEGMLSFAKGFIDWYENPATEEQPNIRAPGDAR